MFSDQITIRRHSVDINETFPSSGVIQTGGEITISRSFVCKAAVYQLRLPMYVCIHLRDTIARMAKILLGSPGEGYGTTPKRLRVEYVLHRNLIK